MRKRQNFKLLWSSIKVKKKLCKSPFSSLTIKRPDFFPFLRFPFVEPFVLISSIPVKSFRISAFRPKE